MISYPNAFHAELDKQIRRRGHCEIKIYLTGTRTIPVDDYSIQNVEITLRNDPLCRELPTEECTFQLIDYDKNWHPDNPNGYYAETGNGDRVTIRFGIDTEGGTVSYGSELTFFLKSSPEWRGNIATFTGTRQLGRMTNEFIAFTQTETMGSLANKAVTGGYSSLGYAAADMEYEIDSDLNSQSIIKNTTLNAYSFADALMAIAFAGRKNLRTKFGGTNGIIQVKDCLVNDPQVTNILIPMRDMFKLPVSDRLPLVRNEEVTYYKEPVEDAEMTQVFSYRGPGNIDGKPFVVVYDRPIIGNTRVSNTTNGVMLQINNNYRNGMNVRGAQREDPSMDMTFNISGVPILFTPEKMSVQINNADLGEDEKIDNPLLNPDNYALVAAYRGAYLTNMRSKFQIDYRGNPAIEPLDLIRVELPYVGFAVCIVLETVFRYAGGFSGSLLVRKLDVVAENQQIDSAVSGVAVSDEAVSDESL